MAYLADMVPMSIARALGRAGGGTSVDNAMRFAGPTAEEWVLLELVPHLAAGGYGHGGLLLWAPDGQLLATGSQTAGLLLFD
jgi:acyl-CoA thioesterase